jgi:hypothetical protein
VPTYTGAHDTKATNYCFHTTWTTLAVSTNWGALKIDAYINTYVLLTICLRAWCDNYIDSVHDYRRRDLNKQFYFKNKSFYGNFINVAAASLIRQDLMVSFTELTTHSHPEPNYKKCGDNPPNPKCTFMASCLVKKQISWQQQPEGSLYIVHVQPIEFATNSLSWETFLRGTNYWSHEDLKFLSVFVMKQTLALYLKS